MSLTNAPDFVVRSELAQAAWENGYRLEREAVGAWLAFDSTTAHGRAWLAGDGERGPWWLASDHAGVVREFGPGPAAEGPGLARWTYPDKGALYAALLRLYALGVSLPDAPLARFAHATADLPRTTEAERLVVQRVGQGIFRQALMEYWGGRCAVTGISDPRLLRASHIVPWAACATDRERLDCHNGLLLSALWDAAFDAGLVSFDQTGVAILGDALSPEARAALGDTAQLRIALSDSCLSYMRVRQSLIATSPPGGP